MPPPFVADSDTGPALRGNGTAHFEFIDHHATAKNPTVALHPHIFRTAAADCFAAAQTVEDLNIKYAYLELTQGWRVLADEADRLRSRPFDRHERLIASGDRVQSSVPQENISARTRRRAPRMARRNSRTRPLRHR
jgi:hypothetical protein